MNKLKVLTGTVPMSFFHDYLLAINNTYTPLRSFQSSAIDIIYRTVLIII